MADKLDFLIRDYITGRLAANIKAEEIMMRSSPRFDNLGIRGDYVNKTAPQEAYLLRLEANKKLNNMKKQQEMLDIFWPVEDNFAKKALTIYYIKNLTWAGVALELNSNRQTVWEAISEMKDRLSGWIYF